MKVTGVARVVSEGEGNVVRLMERETCRKQREQTREDMKWHRE